MSAVNEAEEFEFLAQMEKEAQAGIPPPHPDPSTLAVAGNAVARGVAGVGDMFLNAPANAMNVGKYAAGMAMEAAGHPIWEGMTVTPQPNLIERGMKAAGFIRPENEPKTAGQRILDMAIQAGTSMIGTPLKAVGMVPKVMEAGKNVIAGMTAGTAGGATAEVLPPGTGNELASTGVTMGTSLLMHGAGSSRANAPILRNPVLKQTAQEGIDAGLVIPPSYIKPSVTTNRFQGFAGKAATKQEAQTRNVETVDNMARKAVGIPEGMPIKEGLADVHERANGPYKEVEALRASTNMDWFPRFHSTSLLEDLKAARSSATRTFQEYNRSLNTDTLAKAKAFTREAESIEKDIERVANAAGRHELVQQLKDARALHAKAYDIERALNPADDHVSAAVLGKMYAKKKPLTGELLVIGKFARAFPDAVREAAKIQSPGVSGIEAMAAGGLGALGYGAAGGPAGLMAAGIPLLRGPARSLLLSKGYQNRLLKEPPALNQAMLKSLLAGRTTAEAP